MSDDKKSFFPILGIRLCEQNSALSITSYQIESETAKKRWLSSREGERPIREDRWKN